MCKAEVAAAKARERAASTANSMVGSIIFSLLSLLLIVTCLAGNGTTGVAEIRRDGFASATATGQARGWLLTRVLTVDEHRHFLFINLAPASGGSVLVQILDGRTNATIANCSRTGQLDSDSTRARMDCGGVGGGVALARRRIRLRFVLSGAGTRLYSFWFSPSRCGESNGYAAAGGPGFSGGRDERGSCAQKEVL